jgi:hypothetical protein
VQRPVGYGFWAEYWPLQGLGGGERKMSPLRQLLAVDTTGTKNIIEETLQAKTAANKSLNKSKLP